MPPSRPYLVLLSAAVAAAAAAAAAAAFLLYRRQRRAAPFPSSPSSAPLILLVDNGSIQAASFASLANLAHRVSLRAHLLVTPASARFADRATPPGATVSTALAHHLALPTSPTRLLILPAFFGPSDALQHFLPGLLAPLAASHPWLAVATARPMVDPADPGDTRIARALLRHALAAAGGLPPAPAAPALVLCDHGSPLPQVGAVRAHVAAQLAALLPAGAFRAFSPASMERRAGAAYDYNDPLLEVLLAAPPFDEGHVVVALLFLSPGKHAGRGGDRAGIAEAAEAAAAARGRALRVTFAPLLAGCEEVVEVLRDRLAGELGARGWGACAE